MRYGASSRVALSRTDLDGAGDNGQVLEGTPAADLASVPKKYTSAPNSQVREIRGCMLSSFENQFCVAWLIASPTSWAAVAGVQRAGQRYVSGRRPKDERNHGSCCVCHPLVLPTGQRQTDWHGRTDEQTETD